MITLTYGYKKPEDNDKGTVVFPAMEDNIDRLDGHNHDGTNSAILNINSLTGIIQTLLSASWTLVVSGTYRQQVTMPAGLDYDNVNISFRLNNGDYVFPTVEKISTTQYYVYTNDNTQTYKAFYGL